jgi:hypothetical protein
MGKRRWLGEMVLACREVDWGDPVMRDVALVKKITSHAKRAAIGSSFCTEISILTIYTPYHHPSLYWGHPLLLCRSTKQTGSFWLN